MADFAYSTETTIDAAPEAVFDIVSDLSLHLELAGSGELKSFTQRPPGPVASGTQLIAQEVVMLGDGHGLDVTAESTVVAVDPPTIFSWVTWPILPDRLRRVQWWYRLFPAGDGTRVVHEVEIDFGELQDELMKSLRDNFEQARAGVIRAGMAKTLDNLRRTAEG